MFLELEEGYFVDRYGGLQSEKQFDIAQIGMGLIKEVGETCFSGGLSVLS